MHFLSVYFPPPLRRAVRRPRSLGALMALMVGEEASSSSSRVSPMEELNREMGVALHYVQLGEYALAEESYALALETAQALVGETSRITASILGHLARSCAAQGARGHTQSAFAAESSETPNAPVSEEEELAAKKRELAELMYRRLLVVFDALSARCEDVRSERAAALIDLGGLLQSDGREAEADELMVEVRARGHCALSLSTPRSTPLLPAGTCFQHSSGLPCAACVFQATALTQQVEKRIEQLRIEEEEAKQRAAEEEEEDSEEESEDEDEEDEDEDDGDAKEESKS